MAEAQARVLVVDDDPVNRLLLARSLEREGEVEGQHRFLGIELQIVTGGGLVELDRLAIRLGISEEVVLFQRIDIDLRQRCELLARELVFFLGFDALYREG